MGKTPDQKKNHNFVQKTLTSIIRRRAGKPTSSDTSSDLVKALKTAIKDDPSIKDNPDLRAAFGALEKKKEDEKKFEKKQCPKCGDVHWVNLLHPENCMTYQRACGKIPQKWDEKPESLRKTIDEKAALLKEKRAQKAGHSDGNRTDAN